MPLRDHLSKSGLQMLLEKLPPVEGKQSVWVAEEPPWVNRKALWRKLGLRGAVGRDAAAYQSEDNNDGGDKAGFDNATSVFDPVLCELVMHKLERHSQVVDPFCGGPTRGVVASIKDMQYWGCDIRGEQITENERQLTDNMTGEHVPMWIEGDALKVLDKAPEADLLFSCPPYWNLEDYKGPPGDLSQCKTYDDFLSFYTERVHKACSRVKTGGQACFVVGNFRDIKTGHLYYFAGDTVRIFQEAGFALDDEVILVTVPGKRANAAGRVKRTVRRHQTILFFENTNGKSKKTKAKAKAP